MRHLFAHESTEITPDIMAIAKGIGGGFPIAALLATNKASAGMTVGTHGSTYGGNPLGCAVARKVLETINDKEFLHQVNVKAAHLRQSLLGLIAMYPDLFTQLRGRGLMLGLKCRIPPAEFVAKAAEHKLLCVGASDQVVRILPPLNISNEEMVELVKRLEDTAKNLRPQ